MKCVQCGSKWCGPIVCRFSSVRHSDYMLARYAWTQTG
jgi:hypothetical protein